MNGINKTSNLYFETNIKNPDIFYEYLRNDCIYLEYCKIYNIHDLNTKLLIFEENLFYNWTFNNISIPGSDPGSDSDPDIQITIYLHNNIIFKKEYTIGIDNYKAFIVEKIALIKEYNSQVPKDLEALKNTNDHFDVILYIKKLENDNIINLLSKETVAQLENILGSKINIFKRKVLCDELTNALFDKKFIEKELDSIVQRTIDDNSNNCSLLMIYSSLHNIEVLLNSIIYKRISHFNPFGFLNKYVLKRDPNGRNVLFYCIYGYLLFGQQIDESTIFYNVKLVVDINKNVIFNIDNYGHSIFYYLNTIKHGEIAKKYIKYLESLLYKETKKTMTDVFNNDIVGVIFKYLQ
jgi:hypothetical protein